MSKECGNTNTTNVNCLSGNVYVYVSTYGSIHTYANEGCNCTYDIHCCEYEEDMFLVLCQSRKEVSKVHDLF